MERRQTIQKIKILEFLKSVKSHPTAETVYGEVKKEIPSITLATVYRNLNTLSDDGKILRFEVNKELHFDADTCHHQHFVCKECKKIIDVFIPEISTSALDQVKNNKLFDAECVHVVFSGICKNCKR